MAGSHVHGEGCNLRLAYEGRSRAVRAPSSRTSTDCDIPVQRRLDWQCFLLKDGVRLALRRRIRCRRRPAVWRQGHVSKFGGSCVRSAGGGAEKVGRRTFTCPLPAKASSTPDEHCGLVLENHLPGRLVLGLGNGRYRGRLPFV